MLPSHHPFGLPLALAALTTLCAACGSDPLAAECEQLNSSSASAQLELVGYHPDGGTDGCPAIGPFAIPEDSASVDGGAVACGDGCTCTLGDYQTGTGANVDGVFGQQGTYTTCTGSFTRSCPGVGSCSLSAPVFSDANAGYEVGSLDGCYLAAPNAPDPVDSYGIVIETYGCTYSIVETKL